MNFPTSDMHSFWDINAQQPDSFSALPDDDFLAFLQKQFPSAIGNNDPAPLSFDNPDGVDPQRINSFPPPNLSPPSSDSSPSPPSTHHESSLSRRQSGVFASAPSSGNADPEDGSLKRKAVDNADEPQSKTQHTSSPGGSNKKTVSSASARRKPGAPQDETRLLKRKEQNRAAQRAFRERKEKHVRDLEDKVAALEAKNQLTEQENENLRDLLQRLQNENMMLKQAAFTFSAPHPANANNSHNQNAFGSNNTNHPMQFNFSSPGAGPSKSPMQTQSPPSQYNLNFNSLISFDPNMLNTADEPQDVNMDAPFSFSNEYKTIASNPMFTSFAEPSPADSPPVVMNGGGQQYLPSSFESFDHWTPSDTHSSTGQDALDQLFGGNFLGTNSASTNDFHALLATPPSAISPVSHQTRTPSLSSSSSPAGAASTSGSSPSAAAHSPSSGHPPGHSTEECPKTKEQLSKAIAQAGQSSFVQVSPFVQNVGASPAASEKPSEDGNSSGASCEMPFAPFLRKAAGENGGTPFVMCKGSSFPKTAKSDKNIEVLTAWRTITSNPQFKVGVGIGVGVAAQ
ncbi:transcription factor [Ganoderma sinense ZZ0214-1]|uniref:Transcription factor n=1 Tax=Ganoderma sinense ZZ0214-1 TaxID=1077348 RepID=A0A2G8SAE5_9APHY|nr:transcription factor [Ganoderma sinense ZZ0214-1]